MATDKGLFLVLDGGEGCGKSTQAKLLREYIEGVVGPSGRAAHVFRDPGTTRVGEMIRAILLNPDHTEMGMRCEMLLYMAARAQMMSETILPLLRKGDVVISDRFVSSTLAYQLGGEGLTEQEIVAVGGIAISGRWPDLTMILDMPAERSIARVQRAKDRIEQRPPEYHQRVRQGFLSQASTHPERYRVINADRSVEQVQADMRSAVSGLLEKLH
jgi:dTMP kinase